MDLEIVVEVEDVFHHRDVLVPRVTGRFLFMHKRCNHKPERGPNSTRKNEGILGI